MSGSLASKVSVRETCRWPPGRRWELATPNRTGLGLGWNKLGSTSAGLMSETSAPVSTNAWSVLVVPSANVACTATFSLEFLGRGRCGLALEMPNRFGGAGTEDVAAACSETVWMSVDKGLANVTCVLVDGVVCTGFGTGMKIVEEDEDDDG